MSFALSTGVTGLQAHQKMLDVAGNNLANVNTTAFKASRITFSELLSETIRKASAPTTNIGGTNPQQMGSGVGVSSITPLMSQGNIVNTGNPLDMAIEGEGYFVLSDGSQNLYTRAGAFGVDAKSKLIDPVTGYRVQRIGTEGESDGFQAVGDSSIRVPYEAALPARATSIIKLQGNLGADAALSTTQTQELTSDITFITDSGTAASADTKISALDQYTGTTWANGTITFSGYKPDGTAYASATPATDLTMAVTETTTIQEVLDYLNTDDGLAVSEVQLVALTGGDKTPVEGKYTLTYGGEETIELDWNATAATIKLELEKLSTVNLDDITADGILSDGMKFTFANTLGDVDLITITSSATSPLKDTDEVAITGACSEDTTGRAKQGMLGSEAAATLANGRIVITDTDSGYSHSDFNMSWSDSYLTMPGYFEYSTVGGDEVQNVSITIYDSRGGSHVLTGALVRTDTDNTWDMLLSAVTGNVNSLTYDNRRIEGIKFNASDGSYSGLDPSDEAEFGITFAHYLLSPQTISINLGTIGSFNGLTQFATGESGTSTAVAREQNGYPEGTLSGVSINNEGLLIGSFSNGAKKNIATLQIALFQNTAGLESVGGSYLTTSPNSGEAVATQGLASGAGSIHGGALEKSNADVAIEFVNMIQAQNGFQANARTIRVANDILRELTNLIR